MHRSCQRVSFWRISAALFRREIARLSRLWFSSLVLRQGSSDAHHLPHIGTGWTEFEGTGLAALRQAIDGRTTRGCMVRYPSVSEVGYGQVAMGLAWGYAATPRKMAVGLTKRWVRKR